MKKVDETPAAAKPQDKKQQVQEVKPQPVEITPHSGLTERYLAKGLPTIHLLAVGKLCEESGIPFDPETVPEIGTSGVYYRRDAK